MQGTQGRIGLDGGTGHACIDGTAQGLQRLVLLRKLRMRPGEVDADPGVCRLDLVGYPEHRHGVGGVSAGEELLGLIERGVDEDGLELAPRGLGVEGIVAVGGPPLQRLDLEIGERFPVGRGRAGRPERRDERLEAIASLAPPTPPVIAR